MLHARVERAPFILGSGSFLNEKPPAQSSVHDLGTERLMLVVTFFKLLLNDFRYYSTRRRTTLSTRTFDLF